MDWVNEDGTKCDPQPIVVGELDIDAIAWAYSKCVAFGLENNSMKSAMMMDRLKMMLGGYGA